MPHESHITMYAVQAAQLESFLRTQLEREDIRVSLIAKPSAFPEVRAIHTSQEKWDYLRQVNPLIEELRLRAKGQVLPHEIEVPLPEEEEKEAQ
ncbi:MAG: hypothetical protein NZZ60_05060 [Bacteroidia bacterium]|nr:hypothetical protein [Bacteroidia bacterium]MDW8416917.1 hypothetical protein [Bacteroidia bacterium]